MFNALYILSNTLSTYSEAEGNRYGRIDDMVEFSAMAITFCSIIYLFWPTVTGSMTGSTIVASAALVVAIVALHLVGKINSTLRSIAFNRMLDRVGHVHWDA